MKETDPTMNQTMFEKMSYQQDALTSFYEFHPEAFSALEDEEMKLMRRVYFVDRDIDVDSIDDHLAQQLEADPELPQKLQPALQKLAHSLELDEESQKNILFSEPTVQ